MTHRLLRTPWAPATRGATALVFGLLTFTWPSMTVATFVWLFAALALADGLAAAAVPLRFRRRGRDASAARDPLFVLGATGAALGLLAVLWPGVTMQALLSLIVVWATVTGAGHLYVVTTARPRPPGWWCLGGAGAAALALAALVLLALIAGDVRVGWEIGVYGVASGALLLACAWRLGVALARQPHRRATDAPADTPAEEAAGTPYASAAPAEARAS